MAAETPRPPERPAEYTPLENFVGRWTTAGREKQFTETCEWYPGRFHVVCNFVSKRADGSQGHSMSILSYVPGVGYAYSGIGSKGRYETFDKGRWLSGKFFSIHMEPTPVSLSPAASASGRSRAKGSCLLSAHPRMAFPGPRWSEPPTCGSSDVDAA